MKMNQTKTWDESEEYISIKWLDATTDCLMFDVLPFSKGETAWSIFPQERGLATGWKDGENYQIWKILEYKVYKKDDPKLCLEIMRTMDWQLNGAIIGTAQGARCFLRMDPTVQKLADAYPEQIDFEYIDQWMQKHAKETFQPKFSWFYDLTLAGILVALSKHPDDAACVCIDQAAQLNITELWITPCIAKLLKKEYETSQSSA